MDYTDLKIALRMHAQTTNLLELGAIAVWTALTKLEPVLAAEILQLFASAEAAANWVTTPSGDMEASPAQLVAEGQAAEVLANLRRAAQGFVG